MVSAVAGENKEPGISFILYWPRQWSRPLWGEKNTQGVRPVNTKAARLGLNGRGWPRMAEDGRGRAPRPCVTSWSRPRPRPCALGALWPRHGLGQSALALWPRSRASALLGRGAALAMRQGPLAEAACLGHVRPGHAPGHSGRGRVPRPHWPRPRASAALALGRGLAARRGRGARPRGPGCVLAEPRQLRPFFFFWKTSWPPIPLFSYAFSFACRFLTGYPRL